MKAQPTLLFPEHARIRFTAGFAAIAVYLSARMGISVFEIRETGTKRLDRVFLPALALAVLCLISVNTAQASQRFTASLNGAQETPPNASTGTGYGYVILSDDQTTITVNLGFTGLGTNASDAHIHTGLPGVAGGITFPLAGTPLAMSGTFTQQVFAITPLQVTDLQNGLLYFNIHSGGFPGGEIRGQILLATCSTAGPIDVEATAGTFGPTAYASLNAAFTAINAGTHQGAINVEVCGNTTETVTASLNASGSGPTYTALNVYPLGSARTISGSIVGAVIKLNGADNVTIDGRIGGVGTNRELTVSNTNTSTATAAIWLASVIAGNGASNNVVRNLEVAAGQTATTGTNSTFGIIQTGTTISLTSVDGNDNDNNQFIFNRVTRARYGISSRGVTTNNNLNPVITDNIVGPSAFGPDEIGKAGIYMQADTGAIISRNTVQFVGGTLATTTAGADRCGICIGSENWSVTDATTITSGDYTVTKNIIHDIVEERTFSAIGIRLGTTRSGAPTNNLVANNFLYNIRANGTLGDQFLGIGISGGNTDRVVFNSISITGDMDPGAAAASSTYGNAIRIPGANAANNANFTIQNNSIYLDVNSNTATQHYFAITLNSAAYVFGTGTLNHNNYFINAANPQLRTGGLGTGSGAGPGTEFATLANWQVALTTTQDANSIQADPLYFSNTSDLHIQTLSPNVNAGLTIAGIADDIDAQVRPNGPNPDIGADEFYPSAGSLQFSSATYSATEVGGIATITVTRTGGQNGAAQVDYATVAGGSATGGAACTAGVDYINTNGTLMWADLDTAPKNFNVTICNDGVFESSETVNLALSNAMVATLGTPNTAVLTIVNSENFNGSYNVGTTESLTSLTNPGGVFDSINNGTVSGNTTFNITSDLTVETGAVVLNQFAGGFTLTIQPSGGVARLVSGGNTTALINLNGADGVTFNGLNTGGNSLLIRNTSLTTGSTVQFINDASNNSLLNSTFEQGNGSTTILLTTGTATGNDNNIVSGNVIRDRTDVAAIPFNGFASIGTSAVISNSNTSVTNNQITNFTQAGVLFNGPANDNVTISNNDISSTAPRTTVQIGLFFSGLGTNTISQNAIHGLRTSVLGGGTGSTFGMIITDARATTISRNRIYDFPAVAAGTGRIVGIEFDGASATTASATLVNNMVSIVTSVATNQSVMGFFDFSFGGNTFTADHNSIYIGGTNSGIQASWALMRGTGAPNIYTARNNICFNNRTGGGANHFAAGDQSANTGTYVSNFNFFAGTGTTAANFMDYGVAGAGTPVSFAAWQAGPPARDANSVAGIASGFIPANFFVNQDGGDLHLKPTATPVLSAGTPVAGITTDFDNDPRPVANSRHWR